MSGARLAVDVGAVRIGVARCDADQLLTVPVSTVPAGEASLGEVARLALEYGVAVVYVGLPLSLSGEHTASTDAAEAWASRFAALTGADVRMLDERLSTRTAQGQLRQSGRSTRTSRDVIDQVAASVLLKQALEIERRTGSPAGVKVEVDR